MRNVNEPTILGLRSKFHANLKQILSSFMSEKERQPLPFFMRTTTEAKYDDIEKKLQRNVMIKNNASQYGLSSEQQRNS